jgi:hypothetical protein
MANQQPAYRAFTVIKREGQDDYWLRASRIETLLRLDAGKLDHFRPL